MGNTNYTVRLEGDVFNAPGYWKTEDEAKAAAEKMAKGRKYEFNYCKA